MLPGLDFTVAVFCTLACTCVGINAILTPANHAIFLRGSEMALQCTLNLTDARTAADVVWHKNSVLLSEGYYTVTAINDTISQLSRNNATFADGGNFECGFPGDSPLDRRIVKATVAAPPSPVRNLTCRTHDAATINCQFMEGLAATNIVNTYTAKWQKNQIGVPVIGSTTVRNPHEGLYTWRFDTELERMMRIIVTASNEVGESESYVLFHPMQQVIPNRPTLVDAVPVGDSHHLEVTWKQPEGHLGYFSLKYRIRYTNLVTMETITDELSEVWHSTDGRQQLEDLDPYTEYEVSVSVKSDTADRSAPDLYWSEWATVRERTREGVPIGSPSDVTIAQETDGSEKDTRNVKLEWEPVPDNEKGSEYVRYRIVLLPEISEGVADGMPVNMTVQTTTAMFEDLHRFRSYKAVIQVINYHGEGDPRDYGYVIPDRTSSSSPPQHLKVNRMESVVRMSYEDPKWPNGIIQSYCVSALSDATNLTDLHLGCHADQSIYINCSSLSEEEGEYDSLSVYAVTSNFSGHSIEGEPAYTSVAGVCDEREPAMEITGINVVLWAVLIPTTIIICCVIVLTLWNFCKEFWVEPPDPVYPKSIISNGQFKTISLSLSSKPREEEHFDELNPARGTSPGQAPDEQEQPLQRTDGSYYVRHPKNLPRVQRNLSHDSGFSGADPPSPGEGMDIDTVFHDDGFRRDVIPEAPEMSSVIVRGPKDNSGGRSDDLRDSIFSSGSSDSGAELKPCLGQGGRSPLLSITSSTTSEDVGNHGHPSVDPYLKVSMLPASGGHQTGSLSPSLDEPRDLIEGGANGDVAEHDYLKQYQLSSLAGMPGEGNPYLPMTALTPPPGSPCTPDGYQSFSLLEGANVSSLGMKNNGYIDHERIARLTKASSPDHLGIPGSSDACVRPGSLGLLTKIDDYVRQDSVFEPDPNYRDDYSISPEADGSPVVEAVRDGSKAGYVSCPETGLVLPPACGSYPDSPQMPYSKVAIGD